MKKLFLITLLLTTITSFGFTRTRVIEDEKYSSDAIQINLGGTFYGSNRLYDYPSPKSGLLNSSSFTAEIGTFSSDEDGLIDFVSSNLFGFSTGKVDSYGYEFYRNSVYFDSTEDAKYFNFYGKNLFGVQLNLFAISFGTTIGPKYGFDRMKQVAYSEFNERFKFAENRIFLDFVLNPYVSVNLFHTVKFFLMADFDYPIFRIRFIDHTRENYKSDVVFKWDWFKNDVPVSYMAGVAVFF